MENKALAPFFDILDIPFSKMPHILFFPTVPTRYHRIKIIDLLPFGMALTMRITKIRLVLRQILTPALPMALVISPHRP